MTNVLSVYQCVIVIKKIMVTTINVQFIQLCTINIINTAVLNIQWIQLKQEGFQTMQMCSYL